MQRKGHQIGNPIFYYNGYHVQYIHSRKSIDEIFTNFGDAS